MTRCYSPTPLKKRPEVNFEKIERKRRLLQDRCKGEPPYGTDEYIKRGNKVGILYLRRFATMQVVEGDMTVVHYRGGSGMVVACTGG